MQASAAKLLKTFGRSVRSLRKRRGFSQEDLAEACGLSRNYISDIERGVRNPGLLVLVAMAKALKVPLQELLEEIDVRAR
jgi:transcriptional regulator with XRE-family HTH domain